MRTYEWAALAPGEKKAALARPQQRRDADVVDVVRRIFEDVDQGGWDAVRRWSQRIDKCEPAAFELGASVIDRVRAGLAREDLDALDFAVDNVRRFHAATKPTDLTVEVMTGVRCRRVWRAIQTCGLYVPGGTAPLFSTLVMLAEPARVAGVPVRVAMTPPGASGEPHPMMVAAAAACGLDVLWLVGGAQAIAALTFGAGLPKAQKIFGPGNAYVTEAKRYAAALSGGPAIDVPAGPSELMVIADESSDARMVAADLLSQAEHDADAQVLLVSLSAALTAGVERALEEQTGSLPRARIARAALAQSRVLSVRTIEEAAEVANAYAPEHLSVQVKAADSLVNGIANAGTIFVGAFSAETFGDYVCGPSHVLPTDGAAQAWSGVCVASFMKSFAIQEIDPVGGRSLSAAAARLARLEGLEAHARAADLRA